MIHLTCQTCRQTTDSDHSREAVCWLCLARQGASVELREIDRLIRKRRAWLAKGLRAPNDEQLWRLAQRLQRRIVAVIPPHDAQAVYNQLVREIEDRSVPAA